MYIKNHLKKNLIKYIELFNTYTQDCFKIKKTMSFSGKNVYNIYNNPGITDEDIKLKTGLTDKELDKLIFTDYQKYTIIMEKHKNIIVNIFKLN